MKIPVVNGHPRSDSFCGVTTIKVAYFGSARVSTAQQREK